MAASPAVLTHSGTIAAASLIGGYAVARFTGKRPLGGLVLAAGGALAGRTWVQVGIPETIGLSTLYIAAFGLSHPLAKKIGAWPSVFTVAAVTGAVAHAVADRHLARS